MGASLSIFSLSIFSRKRKSPEESSPPDAHDEQVQHCKKLKVAKATTIVDDYQVFLSFRGVDTRFNFTDVLYKRMIRAGIRVFKDEEEIHVGQPIEVILQAIKNSVICVPILSKSFASSAWCLREVEMMVELGKKVMPIFYKVTADDVKLKTDLYKKDMEKHVAKHSKDQVEKWKSALKKIAKIKGMEVSSKTSYTELCTKFTSDVLHELPPREICHTNHLVGIDKRIESMMKLLDIGLDDRRYVVIHGMSGIGKTTLANAIFDKLSAKFDNTCFLDDIRESSCRKNSIKGQSNLSGDIKERFYKRKVLIVLDDVKKWEHIEKLVGRSCWFGAGSIIIITTKYKDVLNGGALNEDEVLSFEMKTLDDEEAVDLFCWYAFRKSYPPVGFESFSRDIIQDAGGLPLTLTVIGALLYKKGENVWREVISRITKLRFNSEVVERLRISYDELEDDHKKIFLDLACLRSIAREKEKAIYMWEACDLYPYYGLDVLSSMSLIIMTNKSIGMHNQLEYLGKKIVREESDDPSKRSRLWDHKEAIKVLMSKEGKEKVEALAIEDGAGITLSNEHFASCRELRFLQLAGASITGDFENLFPNLRWLSWNYCPTVFNATNLFMKNLVNLDLSWSFINESWGGWKLIQVLSNLKVLDLSYCRSLTRTPEFSENNSLERLILTYCRELHEIHSSIGKLKMLKYLALSHCTSLGGLPDEIGCLVNLEAIYASGSRSYITFELPNSIGCLKSLTTLRLQGFVVTDIPDSIGGLTKLKRMHLETRAKVLPESLGDLQSLLSLTLTIASECKLPNTLGRLINLEFLYISGGANLDELVQSLGSLHELMFLALRNGIVRKIPASIGKLKKLRKLHLDGVVQIFPTELYVLPTFRELRLKNSSFSSLPSTFSQFKLLGMLDLGTNHMLQELPDLPLRLRILRVSSRSLRKIANLSSLVNLTELQLLGADDYKWPKKVGEDSKFIEGGIEKLIKLAKLHLGIATAQKILQFDLCHLPLLESLTLDCQPDLEDSDSPLLLSSASSSSPDDLEITSQGSGLGLKFHNLSTLENLTKVVFNNCLIEDGLDSLGMQHLDKVNEVNIQNCSVELIEQIELIELTCSVQYMMSLWQEEEEKNLNLTISEYGSFKSLPDLSKLKNLRTLNICKCKEVVEITSLGSTLVSLCELYISDCTSLETLKNVSMSKNLSNIYLQDCPKLRTIAWIEGCISRLIIQNCESLVDITGLGSLVSLCELDISGCTSLERLENLSKLENLSDIHLEDCPNLRTIEGIEGLFLSCLVIQRCGSLQNIDELKKRCEEEAFNSTD